MNTIYLILQHKFYAFNIQTNWYMVSVLAPSIWEYNIAHSSYTYMHFLFDKRIQLDRT